MKLKVRVLLLVLFVAVIGFIPNKVQATPSYKNFVYDIESETNSIIILSVKDKSVTEIIVPDEINGRNVTAIDSGAFSNCINVTNIEIPNSVTSIGDTAFLSCQKLSNIELPNSITSIGEGAFWGSGLTSIEIPDNVINIGENAFNCCYSLTSVTINANMIDIKYDAFNACRSLTDITILRGTVNIKNYAFDYCENLTNIVFLGDTVNIENMAFNGCEKIKSITIDSIVTNIEKTFYKENLKEIEIGENNPYYSSIDGILFNKEKTKLILYPAKKTNQSYNIPNTVTEIGEYAFYNCKYLKEIDIPNTITNINEGTFSNCVNLKNINIPNSVTSIGINAFSGCTSLIQINLSNSLVSISNDIFTDCTSLISINVNEDNPNYSNKDGILFNKDKNKIVCYPAGKKNESYIISKEITSIENGAFGGCQYLKYIDVEVDNTEFTSVNGVLFNKDKTKLVCYPSGKNDTIYKVPNVVTHIQARAFYGCKNLNTIRVPQYVIDMEEEIFYGCKDTLRLVTIAESYADVYARSHEMYCVNVENTSYPITNCTTTNLSSQTYSGLPIKPKIVVKYNETILYKDIDYTIEYKDNINVGTATITIKGIEEYSGTKTITFKIIKATVNKPTIQGTYTYNGEEQIVNLNNFDENIMTISNNKRTNTGKQNITIELKDKQNYQWKDGTTENVILNWEIQSKSINNMVATIDKENYVYDGNAKTPIPTMKDGNITLVQNTDYTVVYEDNIEVGRGKVVITGIGNYTGEIEKEFEIVKEQKDIANLTITGITDKTYTGEEIKQNIVVKDENIALKDGTDYTVVYKDNKNAGTAKVTITGKGNYTGAKELTFKINKATYDMSKVKFENLTVTYDGKSHKITATGLPTGVNVTYKNNDKTNVGTYTVTAVFTGDTTNYNTVADKTATLKINAKNISSTSISSIGNQTYTGKDIKPSVVVKDGNLTLKNGTDYTASYTNPRNTGKATITITGIVNYTGTKTTTFRIIPSQVTNLKVKSQKEKEINIQWSKNGGNVTGYKVYYYDYSKGKWIYSGKTSKTNYTIKKLASGTTYKFRVRAYKTIDGTQYFGSYSEKIKISTTPSATKLKSLTTKNLKVTAKWNKVTGATGYEIYMSTSKNKGYSKIKTISKASTVSYTKGSLKKNKTYYFKIRTYRTVNGKKIYSSYSNIKQIKVK